MTHEELLAEIQSRYLHPAQDITNHTTWAHKAKLGDALRAVVELHKPTTNGIACTICDDPVDKLPVIYPCPTIQAIEKELA